MSTRVHGEGRGEGFVVVSMTVLVNRKCVNWAVQADVIDRSVQADRLQGTRGAGPTVGKVGGGVTWKEASSVKVGVWWERVGGAEPGGC